MRKFHLMFVSIFCLASLYAQDLSIATFNCEFLITSKVHVKYGLNYTISKESTVIQNQWNSSGFRDAKMLQACEEVAEQIKTIDADIIGLTEIGKQADVDILLNKLQDINVNYTHVEICKSSDPTGQHVVLLSKFPITVVKDKFLGRALYFTEEDMDETDDTGISKGMHAQISANGKLIDIFLLHLKSERDGYEADAQRIAQAEIARRDIYPLLYDPNRLVVVMGDLNSERRHPTLLKLRGFDDIFPELIQTGDDYYFEDFSTRWTYSYKGNKEQIDHILLSYGFDKLCKRNNPKTNQWGIKTTIIETNNHLISDHNAVKVDFTFR